MTYAEREIALSAIEDGVTYRETLEGLRDRTRDLRKRAKYEAELAVPPFPTALAYLWGAYWRLRRRKGGGAGPEPITWAEIEAFDRLGGAGLRPWEIEAIESLDDVWLRAQVRPAVQ